jgi:hypothetical protein
MPEQNRIHDLDTSKAELRPLVATTLFFGNILFQLWTFTESFVVAVSDPYPTFVRLVFISITLLVILPFMWHTVSTPSVLVGAEDVKTDKPVFSTLVRWRMTWLVLVSFFLTASYGVWHRNDITALAEITPLPADFDATHRLVTTGYLVLPGTAREQARAQRWTVFPTGRPVNVFYFTLNKMPRPEFVTIDGIDIEILDHKLLPAKAEILFEQMQLEEIETHRLVVNVDGTTAGTTKQRLNDHALIVVSNNKPIPIAVDINVANPGIYNLACYVTTSHRGTTQRLYVGTKRVTFVSMGTTEVEAPDEGNPAPVLEKKST